MFAASPGTITGVITLAVAHSKTEIPVTALVAIAVAVAITCLALIASSFLGLKVEQLSESFNLIHPFILAAVSCWVDHSSPGRR